jgi:hypothetical protein
VSTLLVIALLAAAPASENDAERVKEMVGEALDAFDAGRFEEAAQLYLQAHEALVSAKLPEKPMLFFNAGLAYERAGICERAAEMFDRFAAQDRTALEYPDFVERRRKADACAPSLRIESRPSGARVSIDGSERGVTPLELRVRSGRHRIGLALAAHEPLEDEIEVTEPQAHTFALRAMPPPKIEPPAPVIALEASPIGPPVLLWTSTGVLASAVIAASILAVMSSQRVEVYRGEGTVEELNDARGDAISFAHGRNAALVTAGVAALGVAGGIWWTFDR